MESISSNVSDHNLIWLTIDIFYLNILKPRLNYSNFFDSNFISNFTDPLILDELYTYRTKQTFRFSDLLPPQHDEKSRGERKKKKKRKPPKKTKIENFSIFPITKESFP